jgi:hypothetical protein
MIDLKVELVHDLIQGKVPVVLRSDLFGCQFLLLIEQGCPIVKVILDRLWDFIGEDVFIISSGIDLREINGLGLGLF